MQRLLLTLQYDGTRYHGWQVQPNGATVQERLQDAVERLTGVRAGIIGCSRTDAGVHARMFCCTFDTDSPLRGNRMAAALNAHLPEDIAVCACREVAADFHPRYMAQGKRYVYRIWNAPFRSPFWQGYALHRKIPLDVEKMHRAAQLFLGKHDFSAFCSAGSAVEDRVRTVKASRVERQELLVLYTVEADGFLYNMVRIMMGTLLDIEAGRLPEDAVVRGLTEKTRACAGPTAPACGLYLEQVFYDNV